MKKIIVFLAAFLTVFSAYAANNNQDANLRQMLTQGFMSDNVEYADGISLTPKNDDYLATIPAGTLKNTKTVIPSFSFTVKKKGNFEKNELYSVSLNKLIQIYPMLAPVVEQYQITYGSLTYTKDLVPAISFVPEETFQMTDFTLPLDQGAKIFVSKVNEKTVNTKKKDFIEGRSVITFDNIQAGHLFGNVKIDKLEAELTAPVAMGTMSDVEKLQNADTFEQKMKIKNARIDSLFTKAGFNLEESLDAKTDNEQKIDANLDILVNDLFVSEQPDVPEKIILKANFNGFTAQQAKEYEAALRTFNEVQDLPETEAGQELMVRAYQNLNEKQAAFLEHFMIRIEELRFVSPKYVVLLKGTGSLKDEEFNGTLTVVNFNYLAPKPNAVDEKACQDVMDKVLDGSLSGEAFEAAFNEKCNDKKGMLDALRPYAKTAKKTTLDGKDALEFDIQIKGEDIFVNSEPFIFEEGELDD